jgi:hypothetical protein
VFDVKGEGEEVGSVRRQLIEVLQAFKYWDAFFAKEFDVGGFGLSTVKCVKEG